jgi:GWxTD domain-containing protein
MKKIIIISLALFTLILFVQNTQAKNLKAFMSYATFYSPADGSYLETYLGVVGKSAVFVKNKNNKFQGTIEVTLIFKQGNVIKDFKKYNLLSPEVDDTTNIDINFIDQQRFVLPEGGYKMEIQISDLNNPLSKFKANDSLAISFPADKINVSGIQLVDTYKQSTSPTILTKGGYDIVPFIVDYYPQSVNKLTFYSEIYNTEKVFGANEKYLLNYYIESFETQTPLNDFNVIKKEIAKPVNTLFSEIPIDNLPSGNYYLVVDVRNKENKVVASNCLFFQRSNPKAQYNLKDISALDINNTFVAGITGKDSLEEFIQSLYPISNEFERLFIKTQARAADIKVLQQFFLNFWMGRNNADPEKAWANYNKEVIKVNKKYSTSISKGYQTDRGRVYLEYGEPNSISENPMEPNSYPYEIWHYYTLKSQSNKKFVFYTSDAVSNDFELLYSDAIGEYADPAWQAKLQKRNTVIKIDTETPINSWGSNADDFFKNPR